MSNNKSTHSMKEEDQQIRRILALTQCIRNCIGEIVFVAREDISETERRKLFDACAQLSTITSEGIVRVLAKEHENLCHEYFPHFR